MRRSLLPPRPRRRSPQPRRRNPRPGNPRLPRRSPSSTPRGSTGTDGDEGGFFHAVLHMESEGEMGGTDESRAKVSQKYGIRNRSHWQDVKAAVYQMLIRKHGSIEVVSQREMNWRTGETQRMMQSRVAKAATSGAMAPVEGVTLETWAAINASIIAGANFEDLLKGAGIEPARWQRAKTEWEGRMSRDTTFAIATVYGNAFQNASKGKYAEYAKEANAARADSREMSMQPPDLARAVLRDPLRAELRSRAGARPVRRAQGDGPRIIDFVDVSTFMGYHFHRTAMLKNAEYNAVMERVKAKFAAKYPGVKVDVAAPSYGRGAVREPAPGDGSE